MKSFSLFIVLYFAFNLNGVGQNYTVNERREFQPYIDIGVGVGPNYGIFGGKAVIGLEGSGLMIGVGGLNELTTTSFGIQVVYQHFFASIANADYGYYSVIVNGKREDGLIRGTVFMAGGKINLGKEKKFHFLVGAGIASGGEVPSTFAIIEEGASPVLCFGLNYSFSSN